MLGVIEFFREWWKGSRPPTEPQKLLAEPDIIMCGLCEMHIETSCLFGHWLSHTRQMCIDPTEIAHNYGILRTEPAVHNKVFCVTRPDYKGAYLHPRFNLPILTAAYFNYAITVLKLQNPHMRFQYVNAVMGDTGEYLKTLLVIGEWYE